jgi:putative oxidoreductase
MSTLDSWSPKALSLLRVMSGLVFLQHGTQKILHFPAALAPPPGAGGGGPRPAMPPLMAMLAGASGWIELVGGILIVIGLFTRPVAFLISGEMAIAYFMAHAPRSPFPILNGGDLAVTFCFVFLYLAFAGGGDWSLDKLLRRR